MIISKLFADNRPCFMNDAVLLYSLIFGSLERPLPREIEDLMNATPNVWTPGDAANLRDAHPMNEMSAFIQL